MASAAKLFAHAPEGFDPHRAQEIRVSGPNADKIKQTLAANALKAEQQWAEEHRFNGPKAVDDDELAFLQRLEDSKKLRIIEKELEELSEIETYHNEVKSKVYTVEPIVHALVNTPVAPITKIDAPSTNPVANGTSNGTFHHRNKHNYQNQGG